MTKVLVVDDEPRILAFLSRALTAQGFEVALANSQATTMASLAEGGIDVVVLDLLLGQDHGLTVLGEMRELADAPPVIVVSAVTDVPTRIAALKAGAIDVVAKPFNLAELIARIQRHVPEPAEEADSRHLTAFGITLDTLGRTVTMGEVRVILTERESGLLSHLLRHAGEVCIRSALFEDVWAVREEADSNVVDVVVGRLRAKVPGLRIETIRGVGYRLVAPQDVPG